MKWLIVGAGVIGDRRGSALPPGTIVGVVDIDEKKALALAGKFQTEARTDLVSAIRDFKPEAAIIAPINSALVPTAQFCLDHGVHVLIEKPAARSYAELKSLKTKGAKIKIGFNHRFHPAYKDLLTEIKSRPDDPIMFIRARYGNGARVGFDKEWRSKVDLSGGGELLDQGVHVIDLASVLLPGLEVKAGFTRTHYWNMPVDDNGWGILANKQGQTFTFHVSSSEWKNEFQFDVYTRARKYVWSGLGRSYGPETLTIYKMKPEMGPPEVEKKEYPGEDISWKLENENFEQAIQGKSQVFGGYEDALHSLKMVEQIYLSSEKIQGEKNHPKWFR